MSEKILERAETLRVSMEALDSARASYERARKPILEARELARSVHESTLRRVQALDQDRTTINGLLRAAVRCSDREETLTQVNNLKEIMYRLRELGSNSEESKRQRDTLAELNMEYNQLNDDWKTQEAKMCQAVCLAEKLLFEAIKEEM